MALRVVCSKIFGVAQSTKSVPIRSGLLVWTRAISGKSLYVPPEDKQKPLDLSKNTYNLLVSGYDKATLKLDENSKLIVVEGAHCIGKSKFCKDLAEELGMAYVKYPTMDDLYINIYGYDLRNISHWVPHTLKPYDEKDFARNPLGPLEGGSDRLHFSLFQLKHVNHYMAIRHILNTGQGVVMEGSCMSDYIYSEAAFKQGWITPECRQYLLDLKRRTSHRLLRPNLVIYLDAPVEVVQKNIQERGNEWDKDSPVWTNTRYLNDIYNEFKRNYLRKLMGHSKVLVYDWSQPGDAEVVVEDIETLNFDNIPYYSDEQKDWRFYNEEKATEIRIFYTYYRRSIFELRLPYHMSDKPLPKNLEIPAPEVEEMDNITHWSESYRFSKGFNKKLGDDWSVFNDRGFWSERFQNIHPLRNYHGPRPWDYNEEVDGFDLEACLAAQKSGTVHVNHNRATLKY